MEKKTCYFCGKEVDPQTCHILNCQEGVFYCCPNCPHDNPEDLPDNEAERKCPSCD